MTVFFYGYHSRTTHSADSPDTADYAARFVIKVAKIIDPWIHDIMHTISIAILASELPEKLVSV